MSTTMQHLLLLACLGISASAFVVPPSTLPLRQAGSCNEEEVTSPHYHHLRARSSSQLWGVWNAGLNYGKGPFKFYTSFDEWMKPFPDEDREQYPDMFRLPHGCYEIALPKPLGIEFEEITPGCGVVVTGLVPGGNAEKKKRGDDSIRPGDRLIGVTAVKVIGAKWERRLIPARDLGFDTVVGAIGSNEMKWGCKDVVLQFEREGEADEEKVIKYLEFFLPPGDSPWRQ